MAAKKPTIKKSEQGSLTAIAKRDGGLKSNGQISVAWARKKLKDKNTPASTKQKINFFLNFNK